MWTLLCQYATIFPGISFVANTFAIFAWTITMAWYTSPIIDWAFFDFTAITRKSFLAITLTINAITIFTFFAMTNWDITAFPGET